MKVTINKCDIQEYGQEYGPRKTPYLATFRAVMSKGFELVDIFLFRDWSWEFVITSKMELFVKYSFSPSYSNEDCCVQILSKLFFNTTSFIKALLLIPYQRCIQNSCQTSKMKLEVVGYLAKKLYLSCLTCSEYGSTLCFALLQCDRKTVWT